MSGRFWNCMTDLIIVGAGPAGLSAALAATRAGLNFTLLEQDGWGGGQITSSHRVENYPGVPSLSGEALAEAFRAQVLEMGAEITPGEVESLEEGPAGKVLRMEDGTALEARAVIAATGAVPRTLGIPGENLASFCALCDGAFYAHRDVLVVGGGDTAVEDALYLSSICRSVTVAVRREIFRAARPSVETLLRRSNVTVAYRTCLREILGSLSVERVCLERDGTRREEPMDGVFIAVGTIPRSEWLQRLPLRFEEGYVVADETCRTAVPGLFVAGDLRRKPLRQVLTAAADGANAAASAQAYLAGLTVPEGSAPPATSGGRIRQSEN